MGLRRLISPLAMVSWAWYDNPFVDITGPACLVTTLGLQDVVSIRLSKRKERNKSQGIHTGRPHGLVGCRLPFDLPRPPPWGWSTTEMSVARQIFFIFIKRKDPKLNPGNVPLFMATPRTVGRILSHLLLPALPSCR